MSDSHAYMVAVPFINKYSWVAAYKLASLKVDKSLLHIHGLQPTNWPGLANCRLQPMNMQ